jgi:hypothetical protein
MTRRFLLIWGVWLSAQNLPLRWWSENAFYQAAEAMDHGAFSAAGALAKSYLDHYPSFTPTLPPSDLPSGGKTIAAMTFCERAVKDLWRTMRGLMTLRTRAT